LKGQEKDHEEIGNEGAKGIMERKKEIIFPSSLMGHVLVLI
jgi:hypothetical protein